MGTFIIIFDNYECPHFIPTATYYEIGIKVPVWTLGLTLASGAPSYTVDHTGRFIGWSPDSGDVHTPDILRSRELKRDIIDVDEFIRKSKEMIPNKASEATSYDDGFTR